MTKHGFSAYRNREENPPALYVHGSVIVYTEGTTVTLSKADPQGFNPTILLLNLTIQAKPGPMKGVLRPVLFDIRGPEVLTYRQVQIHSNNGTDVTIDIDEPGLQELEGRSLRTYTTGDRLNMDLRPDRVNIELGADQKIVKVWFG
jgi:hypothetical protein